MGQTIVLEDSTVLGRIAIFQLNRSLTGQVGEAYASVAETEAIGTFPARLARRLFDSVPELDHVLTSGSSVAVRTAGEWSAEAHERVAYELRNFFVHWAENRS